MATVALLLQLTASAGAGEVRTNYFADPSIGSDYNDGLTPKSPWKSLDRGQPTQLRVAAPAGATNLSVQRAVQLAETLHPGA